MSPVTDAPLVVVDLGGVVCRFAPEVRLQALVGLTGRRADDVEAAIWGSGLDEAAEAGAFGPEEACARVIDALGVNVEPDSLRAAWSLAFVPDVDVLAVIDDLRTPPVLFTNNGPLLSLALDHELAGVAERFADCVCSWQLGRRKPSPDAFRLLARHLGQRLSDLVFVDDSPPNVAAAGAVGLDALVHTSAGETRSSLAARRLLR